MKDQITSNHVQAVVRPAPSSGKSCCCRCRSTETRCLHPLVFIKKRVRCTCTDPHCWWTKRPHRYPLARSHAVCIHGTLTCAVLMMSSRFSPGLLVLLHGSGDNENGLLPFGSAIAPPDYVIVSLQAPVCLGEGAAVHERSYAWFEGASARRATTRSTHVLFG